MIDCLDIATGIARVEVLTPTLPPATHTNSYALGERQLLLVEPATPYEDEQREWLAWARGLISQGREALAIVLTHHHPDHVGGAEILAQQLDLPIWAHRETQTRVSAPISRLLDDGEVIVLAGPKPQHWQCLLTPGHAPGHLCLVERDSGIAVVGDMVASVGTILVDPYDGDMSLYLAQLERLSGLNLNTALPAHGAPIEQPSALFQHYIAHRLGRESKVLDALTRLSAEAQRHTDDNETNGASLDDLVPIAYAGTPEVLWPLARLSLEAHLIKLVADGKAQKVGGSHWTTTRAAA